MGLFLQLCTLWSEAPDIEGVLKRVPGFHLNTMSHIFFEIRTALQSSLTRCPFAINHILKVEGLWLTRNSGPIPEARGHSSSHTLATALRTFFF